MENCATVKIEVNLPRTLSEDSKNEVTHSGHSHEVEKASTDRAGIVKLNDTLVSLSKEEALTANQGRELAEQLSLLAQSNGSKEINERLEIALSYMATRYTAAYATHETAKDNLYKHSENSLIYVVNDPTMTNNGLWTVVGGKLVKAPWDALSSALTSEPFEILQFVLQGAAGEEIEYRGKTYYTLATFTQTIEDTESYIQDVLIDLAQSNNFNASHLLTASGKTQQEVNDEREFDSGLVTWSGRTQEDKNKDLISIKDFGAVGDGVTDDTVSIQNALDTGKSVFIPATDNFYKITATLLLKSVGQSVIGVGAKSKIVQTNAASALSVFTATNLGFNKFSKIYVIPSTEGTLSFMGGVGFGLFNSSNSTVEDCIVTNHRGGGVVVRSSNNCIIKNNIIRDSVVTIDDQARWGTDINIVNGSYNLVIGNVCENGAGCGIAAQNLASGDVTVENVIANNIVRNQHCYGIILYKKVVDDTIERNSIIGNVIDTITGRIREAAGYTFGAGIYVQTADRTLISDNVIRNTVERSADGTPPHVIHTPASIGVAGVNHCTISNNVIEKSNFYGIYCVSSVDLLDPSACITITGNRITGGIRTPIVVQDAVSAVITGNVAQQSAVTQGIYIRQASRNQSKEFVVSNNIVTSPSVCLQSDGAIETLIAKDNIFKGTTSGYMILAAASEINISGNTLIPDGASASGIRIGNIVSSGHVYANTMKSGNIGIGYSSQTEGNAFVRDNVMLTNTPYHNGASGSMWRVLEDSGTPSVKGISKGIHNSTKNITNFNYSTRGQVFTLKAGDVFIIVNGTYLKLKGNVNFTTAVGDTITFINDDGNVWRELYRSTS